ncbi:MAG: L-glutamate gamma-semialdehyde dehydrogenase [Planctomycetes bacterium]|nr:L-glutamate gamma-semialdehyde dehydrogenase [Planctomycetota bacterium]
MTHGAYTPPAPVNEPIRSYAPDSPETASLKKRLQAMSQEVVDVPIIIGGEEIRTGNTGQSIVPHKHRHVLAQFHQADASHVAKAIDAAESARNSWMNLPWQERAAVFLKAADLLCGPWRDTINAATMLGQSKTCFQAEIDAACELADFWRFNVHYMKQIYGEQPASSPGMWNRLEHRPLDGFVLAITPFNFTSIAGNLPTAPALLGNTTLWKPSSTSILSNYYLMKLMEEAGLPPGVVNFIPGPGSTVGKVTMGDRRLGGVHFTGSTGVFQTIWKTVGNNIQNYAQYPRLVGETGGKDFLMALPDSDSESLAVAMVRGCFEFQGQKCSALSRAYIPRSLWNDVKNRMEAMMAEITIGDTSDFSNFMGAVIDAKAFAKHKAAIDGARQDNTADVVLGGTCDDSEGYFVHPTVIQVADPRHDLMRTELFGPILAVYVYDDDRVDETLELCANTSEYALTGAIFGCDRMGIRHATDALRFAAGNFYINDKPTGAVVGQQPFGGSRASGTNDKAGSILNLLRWVSPRTIKETFVPATDFRYPHMD